MPSLFAEWQPQAATLITWPHAATDWAEILAAAEDTYVEIARHVAARQRLVIVCMDGEHVAAVRTRLRDAGIAIDGVTCVAVPFNDTWTRDYGPLSLRDEQRLRLLDCRFDGWGGRFDAVRDNRVSAALSAAGALPVHTLETVDFVLEGGAIDSDGQGTLLTTADYLRARYGCDRGFRELARTRLGASRLLVADGALAGDTTDSHVDMLVRFADPDTLVYASCEDPEDENHAALARLQDGLAALTRADGSPYRLVALPIPRPLHDDAGHRLPATYVNFLFTNSALLVPQYGRPQDDVARERLAELVPDREVIGIDCRALITQGGALHCAGMQIHAP